MAGDNRVPSTKCVANFIGSPSTRTPPTAATRFDLMHSAYIADTLRIKAGLGDPLLKDVLHKNTIYRLNSSRRPWIYITCKWGCILRTDAKGRGEQRHLLHARRKCWPNARLDATNRQGSQAGGLLPFQRHRTETMHHPREDEVEGERREISLF